MVGGRDHGHFRLTRGGHHGTEFLPGAQLQIEQCRERQELRIQRPPLRERQPMRPALRGMTHRDQQRQLQPRQHLAQRRQIVGEIVHPDLQQIDFPGADLLRPTQRPRRMNRRDDLRLFT